MSTFVVDENGVRQGKVHGVSADEWLDTIRRVAILLSKPDERARQGLMKVATSRTCSDLDCRRLNRSDKYKTARYVLTRDLAPIRPTDPYNEREHRLCEGHPWLAGTYLCEMCARVTTAKRLIDSWRTSKRAS